MDSASARLEAVFSISLVLIALASNGAMAHEDQSGVLEEIVVYGRADAQLGVATSASSGLVGFDDLRLMPLQRVGDLVESMPGMTATQHSGTGKANQYFLRGFDLDHGTDFRVTVAGVPVNLPTHGHGQGYLDLNFIIPEMVETANFRKGPYYANVGDFSAAGSMDLDYYTRIKQPRAMVAASDDGYRRGLALGSATLERSTVTAALDLVRNRGPWELDERLRQTRAYVGTETALGDGELRVEGHVYSGKWRSKEQLPDRALEAGLVEFDGFLDPDLGGRSERYALSARYRGSKMAAQFYAVLSNFKLISNFTYLLEDPLLGDEIFQRDERRVYGANIERGHNVAPLGLATEFRWGAGARFDDISDVGLFSSVSGERGTPIARDAVSLWHFDGFFDAEVQLHERVRINAGLRFDRIDSRVRDKRFGAGVQGDAGADGQRTDGANKLSPKLSVAYQLTESVEAYTNWGLGFHTNDARSLSAVSDRARGRQSLFAEATGTELGFRYEPSRQFNATVVGFLLDLDSELVFAGDSGVTEEAGRTRRIGLEFNGFWRLGSHVTANANFTRTRARLREELSDRNRVPGAIESSFSAGLDIRLNEALAGSLRFRHLGPRALVEDNSQRSSGSTLVNAALVYRGSAVEARLETFNLFDSRAADIEYWYASRLEGEPTAGFEDRHTQPLAPRSFRLSVSWLFGVRSQ